MSTYIKMYRALLDHSLLANDNTAYIVFTKVLLKANWKTGTYRTGRKKLGLLTNLKDTTAWQALKRLENDGALTLVSTGRFTDITICNWWKYQGESEKTVDSSSAHDKQPNDTKQEQKNKERIYTSEEKQLLEIVNRVLNRKFEVLPSVSKNALQQFTLKQIEEALKNLLMDKWHQGKTQIQTLNYFLQPNTLKRFLAPQEQSVPKPSVQIGGISKRAEVDQRATMSRKELQELEQG